jgi:hypothetical protein
MGNSLARRSGGVIAGFLTLLFIAIIPYEVNLWSVTQDTIHVTLIGAYLTLGLICFIGVAWGFWQGEKANKVFGVVGWLVASGLFFVTSYYWATGFVLSSPVDGTSTFIALVMGFWGIVIFVGVTLIYIIASRIGGLTQKFTST